jgi:hypothetical protein
MSKMRMEELEARLLLSGFNPSACSSLSHPLLPSAGQSSSAVPDVSQVNSVRPSEVGGAVIPVQPANLNPALPGNREGGSVIVWVTVGPQGSGGFGSGLAPNAVETIVVAGIPASPEPRSEVSAAPAERTPTTFVSAAPISPPVPGVGISDALPSISSQLLVSSPIPSPVKLAGVDAGMISNLNSFQPHPLPSAPGYPAFLEPAGSSGTPSAGWQSPFPSAPGMAAPLSLAELPSPAPGGHATLPPSLELSPPDHREIPLTLPDLSALEAGLLQFLADLAPQGRQAALLPTPDLSALETGLLRFLTGLGQSGSQLVEGREGAALWMWILAAAGAGAACGVAYRQYRRPADESALDLPPMLGFSLDDAL